MKPRLLDLLACPACAGSLEMRDGTADPDCAGEIATGKLTCRSCGSEFPIRGGVPRLLPPGLSGVTEKTSAAFGWQWKEFVELYDEYEAQFLDWIHPIQPEFFRDKVVLDAGCGNGRHAFYAAKYGAREVVGMDLSDAVDTAYENVGKMPNAHVVQGDINHPPFARAAEGGPFDFIYSIGVLHHMPDPEAGFQSLVRFVRPGGAIFAWVYGRENNAVVHGFINPLRENVTTRIPPKVLPVIAWPMSVVLHSVVKGVYRPLHRTALFKALPSREYLYSLSSFSFRRNYNIVFDHLVAPVAFYLRREEFESWFQRGKLRDVTITWRNRNSWRGFGRVAD
ncbi:MAG TPA: methyltransferase domain-containing protein [Candidatus Dormibacteraeota bacterium]